MPDETFTLQDVFAQSMEDYNGNDIPEFSAVAYAYYLTPKRAFKNRFGQRIDFDTLMKSLTDVPPGNATCYGTHVCYAIACMLRANARHIILSDAMASRGRDYLRGAGRLLTMAQHPDGAWRADWSEGTACNRPATADRLWGDDVLVTGHHLEWLAIATDDSVPVSSLQAAISFLIDALRFDSDSDIRRGYLPASHAARALLLWNASCKINMGASN
jgi:hypothetical protein